MEEFFDTSVPNIHCTYLIYQKNKELDENLVIKYYLTTASAGKQYIEELKMLEDEIKNRKPK
jgi:hypothetical protein